MAVTGVEVARSRAQAVLRVRGVALSAALLPAAVAAVLLAGGATGGIGGLAGGAGWGTVRWLVVGVALVVLLLAGAFGAVLAWARPAQSPTVPVTESSAPELYRLVRDLSARLGVPAPPAIALTPDCDSWLDAQPHRRRHGNARYGAGSAGTGGTPDTVLVIGSPFLWWMRVAELRALLAPLVAGTAAAADPDVAAARRFVHSLDAAVAVAARHGAAATAGRPLFGLLGWASKLLLRSCRERAAEMERAVATWSSAHAQSVDYGLRIATQEQVGLAYAGWDRLLTRVALPAWRIGRWPSQLNAGVVAALTELSRRDRLAEGFETRLGERPACDLLELPGAVDDEVSLLAANLFHGKTAVPGGTWSPVAWEHYPDDVVDRIWRTAAARLHRLLTELSPVADRDSRATLGHLIDRLTGHPGIRLANRLIGRLDREESARKAFARPEPRPLPTRATVDFDLTGYLPEPARTGRDLLTDQVTAMVCCAAVDTVGGIPGLDWLDGPVLFVAGVRRSDLALPVAELVESGDPGPLRYWLREVGVREDKPVRLG